MMTTTTNLLTDLDPNREFATVVLVVVVVVVVVVVGAVVRKWFGVLVD
jgi:hypothetical protein